MPGLLLASTLLGGCGDGDGKDTGADTTVSSDIDLSGIAKTGGIQAQLDPGLARIDTLKARLFDDPENEGLLSELGDAYFEQQRFQEAIPVYEKAVAINPGNPDVLNDLGLSYFYIGNSEKGLAMIEKANEADPTYKHAWLSKGFMLTSLGKKDEAITALNRVKELDPGGSLASAADNFLLEIEMSPDPQTTGGSD